MQTRCYIEHLFEYWNDLLWITYYDFTIFIISKILNFWPFKKKEKKKKKLSFYQIMQTLTNVCSAWVS